METNQPTNMAEGQIASEIQQETGDDDSSSPTTTVSGDGTPADQTTEDQSGNGDDDSRETPKEKEESGGEGSEDSKANDGNNNPDSKVVTEIPAEETSGSKGPENSAAAAAAAAAADESSQTTSTTTQPNHDSIANSKGAQILMTRFSTWSKAANEKTQTLIKQAPAFQENAKTLWERAPNISANIPNISANMPAMPRLQAAMRSAKEVMPAGEKIDGESDPVTSTTTTTTTTAPVKSKGLPGMGLFVKQSSVTDSSVGDEEDEISSSSEDSSDFSVKTEEGKTAEDTDGANSSGEQGERPARRGAALAGLSKAFTAHSGVAESVATGFRGRYNSTAATAATPPPKEQEPGSKPSPESQTSLILKSRVGKHMQDILDKLESHEYAMLLGNGMLGVNLKQCYLKNHGVFIDFLVEGGQAQASSVVRAGDLLIKLGDVDLRKGIIMEVPQQIARERRPIVLILASGTKVPIERMNYIDITVAMMHRAREFYNKRGSFSSLPGASPQKEQTDDAENSQKEEKNVEPIDLFGTSDIKSICEAEVPVDESADNFVTPPAPTMALRKEFFDEIAVRSFDKFIVSGLWQVKDLDANFRMGLRNAFLTCAIDSRRLPFLARYLAFEDELPEGSNEGNMTPSAHLMLFLELMSFLDLYSVTPATRLRDITSRVAYKFFLPTKIGNRLQPPLFDFHHIVADSSLRHLEFVLSGKSGSIPRDVFLDFQKAVVDSLAGSPFISFLTSMECARMRAYLRNTAPYVNLPLKDLFDALAREDKQKGAKNCFAYILLFLIGLLEKEPAGEHNFGREDDNKRSLGASNDLCCAIFIKRNLMPTLADAKAKLDEPKAEGKFDLSTTAKTVVEVCEKFWDIYIAGTFEFSSKSSELEAAYKEVRSLLEKVAAELCKQGPVEFNKGTIEAFVKANLIEKASILADELIYNYAANVHTKFREHKMHEWMCNELTKVRTGDPHWTNKQELPVLPQGCIKRLLRKADLPEGVSSHKPFRISKNDNGNVCEYPNADYAVVFGSTVGTELASQMPIPGIETSDIRRYACFPISLDKEHDYESFQSEEVIPPTFESYAIAPPRKSKPFEQVADETRLSSDKFDVSLLSFTIPNANSSDEDSALFGVSLFFQQKPNVTSTQPDRVKTEFIHEEKIENTGAKTQDEKPASPGSEFTSPVSFDRKESSDQEVPANGIGKTDVVRQVKVSSAIPKYNERLQETPWTSRVKQEEYRDQSQPLSIGLALVSRRNVILSMRDTLSKLLFDYSRQPSEESGSSAHSISCATLVDVLGSFCHRDIENKSLQCILEPYLRAASAPWIDRPIANQEKAFESLSLRQFSDCLPPTPLALLFVTALLEQKIVLSSSRRSVLHSASVALSALLHPLKWSHLLVPLVPTSLAGDLIQYPAPFILGIPSDEAQHAELIGNLPKDVTLVDLDVGRVILAPAFGHDNEMVRRTDDWEATAKALRAQVLYLAQALGTVFGNSLRPETWCCDSPSLFKTSGDSSGIENLLSSAQSFINELLEGVTSCCYWIEEESQVYGASVEPTVLFDEDKFFKIKNHRATNACKHLFPNDKPKHLALSLGDFDLVLESFLRCQSMSTYISSRPKTEMVYY